LGGGGNKGTAEQNSSQPKNPTNPRWETTNEEGNERFTDIITEKKKKGGGSKKITFHMISWGKGGNAAGQKRGKKVGGAKSS